MMLGTIRPMALSHLSQAFRSLVIARRCHAALYGCWLHNFLPEVSPGSLARVQVLGRHSGCRAWGALRARGSPLSHSILSEFGSALMVQGAWAYRYPAKVSRHLQLRLEKLPTAIQAISWKAQVRLCKRYRQLMAKGKHANQVVVAIARELSAFMWAIAKQVAGSPKA